MELSLQTSKAREIKIQLKRGNFNLSSSSLVLEKSSLELSRSQISSIELISSSRLRVASTCLTSLVASSLIISLVGSYLPMQDLLSPSPGCRSVCSTLQYLLDVVQFDHQVNLSYRCTPGAWFEFFKLLLIRISYVPCHSNGVFHLLKTSVVRPFEINVLADLIEVSLEFKNELNHRVRHSLFVELIHQLLNINVELRISFDGIQEISLKDIGFWFLNQEVHRVISCINQWSIRGVARLWAYRKLVQL